MPAQLPAVAGAVHQAQTFAIAETTASMFLSFSAATQIRPESTPYTPNSLRRRCICAAFRPE